MPTLLLKVSPPPTSERSHALARALTDITAQQLGKRREVTAVVIEHLPPSQWWIGAEAVAEPTAYLEISITEGTNTPAEKAAFIAAAFAELQQQLAAPDAALAPASYVVVRELPAQDWGYGGVTQLARRQALQP